MQVKSLILVVPAILAEKAKVQVVKVLLVAREMICGMVRLSWLFLCTSIIGLILEGNVPPVQSPLLPFLRTSLPDSVTIQDACLEVLCLLRILNALNLYWNYLYPALDYKSILLPADFLNRQVNYI